MSPAKRTVAPPRPTELVLAHAHLRLGSLALARTELETLAGLGRLDTAGLIDLAEARWRSGDIVGAGEAATAALRADEEQPIALLIASEAASANGRPSEARRIALRAMTNATGSIDVTFAGMPRSSAWPPDADEPPPAAPTMFDRPPEAAPAESERPAAPSGTEPPATASSGPVALGFWDEPRAEGPTEAELPDPPRELEAGRAALAAGSPAEAALHFGLALRLAPALAPAVLEATAGSRVAALILVRGDAYRLAGHELEAREAFLLAAQGGLPERRKRSRSRPARSAAVEGADPTTDSPATDPRMEADGDADADAGEAVDGIRDEAAADEPASGPDAEVDAADDAEPDDTDNRDDPDDPEPAGAAPDVAGPDPSEEAAGGPGRDDPIATTSGEAAPSDAAAPDAKGSSNARKRSTT